MVTSNPSLQRMLFSDAHHMKLLPQLGVVDFGIAVTENLTALINFIGVVHHTDAFRLAFVPQSWSLVRVGVVVVLVLARSAPLVF